MFFYFICFWLGFPLFTDLEFNTWRPLLLTILPISSRPLRLLLNSVGISSVLSRSLFGWLAFEYFLRSKFGLCSSSLLLGTILLSFASCLKCAFDEIFLTKSSYLIPSKYGCLSASTAVNLSAGFIRRSCLRKLKAFGESFPRYFLSIVSRLWIYGNFMPRNRWFLRKV